MSLVIRNDVIGELGKLHYGRKKLQPASRDIRGFYTTAKTKLQHPLLTFGTPEIQCIGAAFARVIKEFCYTCYACVIMPDHIHILIRKHRDAAEMMIANLQRESHLLLRERGLRDMDHPVWGGPGWKVFLDHPDEIRRTIPYIEDNTKPWHLPKQTWPFVTEYDGWPLHPGHNPNSSYARRQRMR